MRYRILIKTIAGWMEYSFLTYDAVEANKLVKQLRENNFKVKTVRA